MGNLFKAHIFKERTRGPREEVKLKLFNLDGSPAEIGGGGDGGTVDPIFGKFFFDFADPVFIPDNVPVSFDDIMGQSRYTGFEFDDTKLLLPAGIYEYSMNIEVNIQNVSGTYLGVTLNFNYEWEEGMPDYIVPAQLSLDSGPDAIDKLSREVPYATSMAGSAWGIAETDSYLEVSLGTDFVELEGSVGITIARVVAL